MAVSPRGARQAARLRSGWVHISSPRADRAQGESRATAAKQYVAEALADEEGLSVMGVELAEKNGFLELRVLLRYENETGEAVVTIGGE